MGPFCGERYRRCKPYKYAVVYVAINGLVLVALVRVEGDGITVVEIRVRNKSVLFSLFWFYMA